VGSINVERNQHIGIDVRQSGRDHAIAQVLGLELDVIDPTPGKFSGDRGKFVLGDRCRPGDVEGALAIEV
jgi:hypothetical protein